jgi:hypothetical protein
MHNNKEVHDLYSSMSITGMIKSRMIRSCTWHILGRTEMHAGFWWGNIKERDHFEDLDTDKKIILKWLLRNRLEGHGLD